MIERFFLKPLAFAIRLFAIFAIFALTMASVAKFATAEEGKDDCMLKYVDQLLIGTATGGTAYLIKGKYPHVEAGRPFSLKEHESGTVSYCLVKDGSVVRSVVNTHYCGTTYALKALGFRTYP